MFEIKFQSAGISPRPNVFSKIDTAVVYASKSNIFIITLDKKTCVIVRDSSKLITFLYTFDNYIVISDINGSAEMYSLEISNGKMTQKLFNCCEFKSLLSGVYVTNDNTYIGITMDKIMIGSSKEIQAVQNTESIPSYVTGMTMDNKEYITVAYEDGKLDIYEYNSSRLNLAYSVNAHQNGIKCAKIARFESSIYLVTASLDTTLKVWRYESTDGKMTLNLLDILNGHNDWVFGCEWSGRDIISASGDNSVIIWKFDGNNKWSLENRLGGIREKNQTFFAALEIHGNILAHSLSGGSYFYEKNTYKLRKFFSGHTDEITSLDVKNDFITTTSLDFTTRLYSKNLCEEIGRPQIHGYSVMCAKFLKKAELEIVSGADETILRIYKPTKIFLENYSNITKNQAELREIDDDNSRIHYNGEITMIAKQSELSLTNENSADRYDEILAESNTERNLSTNFMFAECLKVYGHYFEICNVAVCDRFIATVNKSKNFEFSGIFIWDYNYNKIDYIKQHDLNIVNLCFSADGEYLMAASRDTKVSIYKFMNDKYVLQHVFTVHNRIVNDCGISIDKKYAFSVSKDRKMVMYDLETMEIAKVITLENEITSLAVFEDQNAIVVGLCTGHLAIYKYGKEAFELIGTLRLHAGNIKCAMFADKSTLLTGGSDGMLNIIKINL